MYIVCLRRRTTCANQIKKSQTQYPPTASSAGLYAGSKSESDPPASEPEDSEESELEAAAGLRLGSGSLSEREAPGGTKEWTRTGGRECRAFSLFGASVAKFASVIK